MNCPHCQQENELLTRAGQRLYYRCARCGEIYWGLLAPDLPAAESPSPKIDPKPTRAPVKKLGRGITPPAAPGVPKTSDRRAAIRVLLHQVKARARRKK